MQIKVNIKPLSINQAFKGKRFKTTKYKLYEHELLLKLPSGSISKDKPLALTITVGFSSRLSDLSNIIKPLEDILCIKYGFDDRWNYKITMMKKIVKKGEEYLIIDIDDIEI